MKSKREKGIYMKLTVGSKDNKENRGRKKRKNGGRVVKEWNEVGRGNREKERVRGEKRINKKKRKGG